MMSAVEYWVWLGLAFGSANGKTDEIIRRFESAEGFYSYGDYRAVPKITQTEVDRLRATSLETAKRIVERMYSAGIAILTPEDRRYPMRLKNIYGMPCALYVDGDLGDLDNELAVAMVGTRNCSDYGRRAAAKISGELARAGAVIVSGLAAGVDTVCHTTAVNCGQKNIAVLGCGIDKTYPTQNMELREKVAKNGAVVSEFAPGTPPYSGNFPIRNRIISGLSEGVVVVEAGERSGSLITARLALEQGRDVFAVPGDIFSTNAGGMISLLRQGAIPIGCGTDVLDEYSFRFVLQEKSGVRQAQEHLPHTREQNRQMPQTIQNTKEQAAPTQLNLRATPLTADMEQPRKTPQAQEQTETALEELSPNAAEVYQIMTNSLIHIEEISIQLQKPISKVLTALTELEIMGLVCAQPGNRFKRLTSG